MSLRSFLKFGARSAEIILLPITAGAALITRQVKRIGYWRLPVTRKAFDRLGVTPVLTHYYEPIVAPEQLRQPLSEPRMLEGIDMNEEEQLRLLQSFDHASELAQLNDLDPGRPGEYYVTNKFFFAGDAEYYFSIIRSRKPKRIIEIGSGFSTLVAMLAIQANRQEDASYLCEVKCIEPFHNEWLERTGASIIRSRLEELDHSMFAELEENDILFIDSSHAVKPQGDVLTELFEILPSLANGVYIHIHDIFTPKDYPQSWVLTDKRLWHEQYVVEALLMYNDRYKIVGALNYLYSNHRALMEQKFPKLAKYPASKHESEPASLWLRVNRE